MGTRNLTMVIRHGETKVAQYGQWDGYPDGQGRTIVDFIKDTDLGEFEKVLDRCRFVDNRKQKSIDKWFKSIGVTDGWMNMEQAELYHKKYPLLTRDNGAGVLHLLMESNDKILWLQDSSNFAYDALFCEWAYVIDLDKKQLEVYKGFNKEPIDKRSRFNNENLLDKNSEYTVVAPYMTIPFKDIERKSVDTIIEEMNNLVEEE
jgi:hypothetical protein